MANLVAAQRHGDLHSEPRRRTTARCAPTTHHDHGGALMERRIRWLGDLHGALLPRPVPPAQQHPDPEGARPGHRRRTTPGSSRWRATTPGRHPLRRRRRAGQLGPVERLLQVPAGLQPLHAVLFSQIVGYDSIIYGKTGIEAEYNSYLESHTRPAKTLRRPPDQPDDHRQRDPDHRHQAPEPGGPGGRRHRRARGGAVVIDPKTGAIEAMYGNPDLRPRTPSCRRHHHGEVRLARRTTPRQRPTVRSCPQAFQQGSLPGSTFKTVTSAAVYDHQPALAKLDYPGGRLHLSSPSRTSRCATTGQRRPEQCGGCSPADPAGSRATPPSPPSAWTSAGPRSPPRPRPSASTRSRPSTCPAPGVSAFPSGPLFNLDNKPFQAYSAFGQQDVVGHRPADGSGGRRLRQQRGDHDAARHAGHPRHVGHPPRPPTSPHRGCTATNPLTAAAVTSLMQAVVDQTARPSSVGFPAAWDVAAKTGTAQTGPQRPSPTTG